MPEDETTDETEQNLQLQMVLPAHVLADPPTPELPEGYALRVYRETDADALIALERKAGFQKWDRELLDEMLACALPRGIFVVEHAGELVATAMATHNPTERHPFGGEVGWVAGDPAHSGRGLGRAVCAAVIRRYAEAGYERVYLATDDARLPALRIYLQLGFEPLMYAPGMEERWRAVRRKLQEYDERRELRR
jgi:mycothiol synthase